MTENPENPETATADGTTEPDATAEIPPVPGEPPGTPGPDGRDDDRDDGSAGSTVAGAMDPN
jgi:hypothetical protein